MPPHGQQQRHAQEHGGKAGVVGDQPDGAGAETADGKEPGRDQRGGVPADMDHERCRQDQPGGQHRPGARRRPSRCLGQRRAYQPHRAQRQDGPHPVGAPAGPSAIVAARGAVPRQDHHARHQGGHDDGHVDEEDPAPARRDQQPTQHRAAARGDPADPRPYPNRGAPLIRREHRQRQPQRGGHQHRGPGRLQHPAGDQHGQPRRHRAPQRRDAEHHEPGQEEFAAPDAVGGPPGGQQQRGQHDGVHVEDPRDVRQRRRGEVVLQRRERDVDHPQVEDGEELGRRHHRQHGPPPPAGFRLPGRLLIQTGGARCCCHVVHLRVHRLRLVAWPKVGTAAFAQRSGRRVRAAPPGERPERPASGRAGGGLILRHDAGRDAPPVADLDARVLRPRPDVAAAPTARWAACRPAPPFPFRPAGVDEEGRELPAERPGVCLLRSISYSTPSSPNRTVSSAGPPSRSSSSTTVTFVATPAS